MAPLLDELIALWEMLLNRTVLISDPKILKSKQLPGADSVFVTDFLLAKLKHSTKLPLCLDLHYSALCPVHSIKYLLYHQKTNWKKNPKHLA